MPQEGALDSLGSFARRVRNAFYPEPKSVAPSEDKIKATEKAIGPRFQKHDASATTDSEKPATKKPPMRKRARRSVKKY